MTIETFVIDIKLEEPIMAFLKIPCGPVSPHAWKRSINLKSGPAEASH